MNTYGMNILILITGSLFTTLPPDSNTSHWELSLPLPAIKNYTTTYLHFVHIIPTHFINSRFEKLLIEGINVIYRERKDTIELVKEKRINERDGSKKTSSKVKNRSKLSPFPFEFLILPYLKFISA
jgi:hypothetical protein